MSDWPFRRKLKLLLWLWTVGQALGLLYSFLRITRRVEIKGRDGRKLDPRGRGLLVIANHPSPVEPMFMTFLSYPRIFFHLGRTPVGLPGKEYYDRRWFWPIRIMAYPIDRSSMRRGLENGKEVEAMLKAGRVVLMHPERERVYTEKNMDHKVSKSGKRMMKFRPGVRRLFLNTNCRVLPVWFDGGQRVIPNKSDVPPPKWGQWPRIWRKVTIKIGEPMEVPNLSRDEVLDYFEDALLALADR